MFSLLGNVLRTYSFQDNYLIEVRGDVQESLPSMDEDKAAIDSGRRECARVLYGSPVGGYGGALAVI